MRTVDALGTWCPVPIHLIARALRSAAPGEEAPAEGWPYALAVIGSDGETTSVSTWRATPGTTARISAGTALTVSEITAVEIRSVTTGRVLMRYDLDG